MSEQRVMQAMKQKAYPIQIWHLDEDPQVSASYLSNGLLHKSIKGCIQALLATRFYFIGIRSKKFYKFFFSKEKKEETMDKFFPLWPFEKPPLFTGYESRQSKWCRKCKEHVDYIVQYLDALLLEYEFRFKKSHASAKFLEWQENDAPQLKIPEGHLKKVTMEWKCLNPKFRSKNIIEGYRAQCKALLQNEGIKIRDFTNRDMPSFLLDSQDEKGTEKWLK